MGIERDKRWIKGIGFIVVLLWSVTATAQTYNSGSTGVDGAFAPITNTTLTLPADGILNYTTVTIPAGVTVTFNPNVNNTPVIILATGDVTISGTISVNGTNSVLPSSTGPMFNLGAPGGPGGFPGGQGGMRATTNQFGSTGQGPGGGGQTSGGSYGAPAGFLSLIPLFGGSGGGGGKGGGLSGASGAGGGGAIAIASSTRITLNGAIMANGGDGYNAGLLFCDSRQAGGGSGGAIRLVAQEIIGSGSLGAGRGRFGCGGGSAGLIRLEAFNLAFTGSTSPLASTSITPGPVTAASTPPLVNLPTLTISAVGGISSPANPGGSLVSADISLPATAVNPIPVTLTTTNTPVGTVFTVRLLRQFTAAVDVASAASIGSFSTATATANVTFPSGQVSVLNAFASFTLPAQTASLYPLIDGEPVDRIMLAANYGGPSTVTLITKSGKKVTVDQLLGKK